MSLRFAKHGQEWGVYEGPAYLGTVFQVRVAVWNIGPDQARGHIAVRWSFRDALGRVGEGHWRGRDRAAHALRDYVERKAGAA